MGSATGLSAYAMASRKTYAAEIAFGATTTTDDAEGEILHLAAVPEIEEHALAAALHDFLGEIDQVPPRYSAIRHRGQRAYKRSRAGEDVHLASRRVTIYSLRVDRWTPPRLRVTVETGPGTYIRALARDCGQRMNSAAYLHSLVRLRSGQFSIQDAVTLESLERNGVCDYIQPSDSAVRALPALVLGGKDTQRARHGSTLSLPGKAGFRGDGKTGSVEPGTLSRLYGSTGEFIGLARAIAGGWHPFKVLNPAA